MTTLDTVELLVIGAGINGAAIARDAALRGLSVALVEQDDIGCGTTAWSSRLIHGGLRYLEHGEIGLVRESLRERELLLRNAPHLVRALPFLLPIYARRGRSALTTRAGMLAYDALSPRKTLPRHQLLSRMAALRLEPGLESRQLRGAALYWDAQAEYPERIAVENTLDARAHGALLLTHTRVVALTRSGARLRYGGRDERVLSARVIVNASGPWLDELLANVTDRRLVGGTKGSHIVVEPFAGAPTRAVYAEARSDGRPVFVIPWLGHYLLGATDTRFAGDPATVRANDTERAYLLGEANGLFPYAHLTSDDIRYSYAGVRPLPYHPSGSEGAISRRHGIHERSIEGISLFSIVGGKLTTHRRLAEQVVDRVCARLGSSTRCQTAATPLPGAANAIELEALLTTHGLSMQVARRLAHLYGARSAAVLALCHADAWLNQPLLPDSSVLRAEIAHAFQNEAAETLTDVLLRRVMLGLEPGHGLRLLDAVLEVAQRRQGWDAEHCAAEASDYRAYLQRFGSSADERPAVGGYNPAHEQRRTPSGAC